MHQFCVRLMILTLVFPCYVCQLLCLDVAEVGSSTLMTCIYDDTKIVQYFNPSKDKVAACKSNGTCDTYLSCQKRCTSTNMNTTHNILNISNIQLSDEGQWSCDTVFGSPKNCSLLIVKTPTCHITSGNDTNNLDIHGNISLSVNATDYYCSTPIDFLLRAGNTQVYLLKNHTVEAKTETSDVFNRTFNVTEKHIGSVELSFICNNVNKTVECGGVQTLQRRPPMCNLTANRDEGGLNVGDEIAMTVYIEDYFCSHSLEFRLQTGGETDRLDVTGIYNETITFTIKESHFGLVYLHMNCNDVSQNLTCDGIKQLRKRQNTTTSTFPPDCGERNGHIIPIVAGIVAGVAFTIAISILIWYLVMLRRKSSGKSSGFKDVPYADVSDNVNTRPKSIRFDGAYAEVTDTNGTFSIKGYDKDSKPEIQMVPNAGYESVDDVREELSQSRKSKVQNTDNSDIYSKVNKNRVSSVSVDGFC